MSAEAEAPAEQRKKRPAAKQTVTAIIHSLWDERDEDYAPEDHATYSGNLLARGTITTISTGKDFSAWTFSETEGELWTYEYDLQNRMTKANYSGKGSANLKERGSYVYDYRGLLIKKTYQNYNPSDLVEVVNDEASKPVTEFFEYTADGRVIYNECSEENNTKKTTYIWANTTLWCEVNEGVVYYHHTDHLGTTEVVTDENGIVVWEAGYEAFGSVLSERGDSSFTPSYTGKFFDKASGLYYFNARWYDSELGKFTTCDPIRDGLNWWNYCNGNPLSFVDSDGLEGRFFGYLQRLLSFDNSSFGITPNNNNNINFKVPTPKSVVEDASLDFISNFDQNKALDVVQNGLDFAGMIFDPADALNGTISLARGNYVDAGLNFVSVVPLVGDAIGKGGKVTKKIITNSDTIFDIEKQVIKHSDEFVDSVKWTNHGFKHFPSKNTAWKDIVKSTKKGPAKYANSIKDIEKFEREAWNTGTNVVTGKNWRVKEFENIIGASGGKETRYIRIENSNGTIHGHPITENEYRKLLGVKK